MKLLIRSIRDGNKQSIKNDVKLVATGNLDNLPESVMKGFAGCNNNKNNKLMTLNLALSYSSRWDILN